GSTSACGRRGPCFGGGIRNSSSSAATRAIISEASGSPGTTGTAPDLAGRSTRSRMRNESPPARFTPPRQGTHRLWKIGRICRAKSTRSAGGPALAAGDRAAIGAARQASRWIGPMAIFVPPHRFGAGRARSDRARVAGPPGLDRSGDGRIHRPVDWIWIGYNLRPRDRRGPVDPHAGPREPICGRRCIARRRDREWGAGRDHGSGEPGWFRVWAIGPPIPRPAQTLRARTLVPRFLQRLTGPDPRATD